MEDEHGKTLLGQIPVAHADVLRRSAEWSVEQQHYAAIGRVAAAWSFFEATIDTASLELADLEGKVGVCFTAQIAGSARKLDAYIALAKLHGITPRMAKSLHKFATDTKALSEIRNRTVHDVWFFNHPGIPERFEATAQKAVRLQYVPTSTESLLKLARDINDHCDKFSELSTQVLAPPQPSPDKPPPEQTP
jgi:hypothetical protein